MTERLTILLLVSLQQSCLALQSKSAQQPPSISMPQEVQMPQEGGETVGSRDLDPEDLRAGGPLSLANKLDRP